VALRGPRAVKLSGRRIGRHPPKIESAVYYCCLEALQNATKHGGPAVEISVTLREDADSDELKFEVTDDGPGFDSSEAQSGTGLQNMRDRLSALRGHLTIVTAAVHGTVVSGSIPLRYGESTRDGPSRTARIASEGLFDSSI
jgi:signal transduction histidine kinase